MSGRGLWPPRVPVTAERWFSPPFRTADPDRVRAILNSFAASSVIGYDGCCAALAGADFRDWLHEILHPCLAISGGDDPVCPPADLAALGVGVRRGEHISLSGRHLVNLDAASRFGRAVWDFLIA